jgi:uncharacterized protein (DUF433 family)
MQQVASEIVSDPDILGGTFVVKGTRVPVENVLAAIQAGESKFDIFRHYPSLPIDGVETCVEWEKKQKQQFHA